MGEMHYFSESYDENLKTLDMGGNIAYIPLENGVYKSVFFPATEKATQKALDDPLQFALLACRKTREFAVEGGYEPLY